ncbi:MAG: glycosyltransferase family 1 protein [Deltaproteobacteria bacterium]|nr:glycosyltransferase family 1 protein [Deltaproteobacteria bacterium]
MRVVVTGLIATYPVGGVAWDYLQYVHGLVALGHDVTYLEDTGQWVYSPGRETFTDACEENVGYLARALGAGANGVSWAFRDPRGVVHGLGAEALARRCREADLFLNVSGCGWLRDEYRGRGVHAYVDTDPCYSQAKLAAATTGGAGTAVRESAAMIRSHDVFFSYGANLGAPDCAIPAVGLVWHPTRPPIVLADWPASAPPGGGAFTTVMSWKIDRTPPTIDGRVYGGKDVEFAKILSLPGRTSERLEVALAGAAPRARLAAAGWRLRNAREASATPEAYRAYLAASSGELSVAKEAYVATRSGWFSSRSTAYLALGRPVIVQDTGLAPHYPLGDAILPFADLEGAVAALGAVREGYARRCAAARAVAVEAFGAERVLGRLLADAGCA